MMKAIRIALLLLGAPCYGAITFVIASASAGGATGGTTASVNTAGANFIFVCVSSTTASPTVSDSKSNTWTALNNDLNGFLNGVIFYAKNAASGSGHTFTVSGANGTIAAASFSGVDPTAPFDVQSTANSAGAASLATGSITPTQNNDLIASCGTNPSSTTWSVNSSLTVDEQHTGDGGVTDFGGALGHFIQGTAAAINPTWTASASNKMVVNVASFKVAPAVTFPPAIINNPRVF